MIDSDEEAQSPAHHYEFRQAEVVLPHLPSYHSLTMNPLFYGPFPNTSDKGWRCWWKTCHKSLPARLPPYYFFPPLPVFPLHSSIPPSVILCPPPPLFPPSLASLSLLPSLSPPLSHHLPPAFRSLPSTLCLLAPNSCCCARMGLNLTQVWMAKKKTLSAHLPHTFFFLTQNSQVVQEYLRLPLHRNAEARTHDTDIPWYRVAHHTIAGTLSAITLRGDEQDSALD